jgi:peptide-methionine (S)-S-oxide reductase
MQKILLCCLLAATSLISCAQKQKNKNMNESIPTTKVELKEGTAIATFGEGCFWCTESFFQRLEGVISVSSGYSGGHKVNPTYDEVCEKTTGHAEVLHIVYEPSKISYDELLIVFWKTHDPTTLNQQGGDFGPQYRSVVFYHTTEQKEKAEKYKAELDKAGAFSGSIVTVIEPFKNFYAADDYHQNFYNNNVNYGYCRMVIRPKLDKFEKVFKDKLKKSD